MVVLDAAVAQSQHPLLRGLAPQRRQRLQAMCACTYLCVRALVRVRVVETYDVTTIRASVPMMLLSRVMRNYGIRFVLSGEGSDEIFAGYLYNYYCPGDKEMFDECIRKVKSLCWYDCLTNTTMCRG